MKAAPEISPQTVTHDFITITISFLCHNTQEVWFTDERLPKDFVMEDFILMKWTELFLGYWEFCVHLPRLNCSMNLFDTMCFSSSFPSAFNLSVSCDFCMCVYSGSEPPDLGLYMKCVWRHLCPKLKTVKKKNSFNLVKSIIHDQCLFLTRNRGMRWYKYELICFKHLHGIVGYRRHWRTQFFMQTLYSYVPDERLAWKRSKAQSVSLCLQRLSFFCQYFSQKSHIYDSS